MQQIIEFAAANPILITIFIVLLFLLLRTFIATGGAKSINAMEAVRMMNQEDPVILDVRTQDEYKQGHITSSKNIPMGLLDARISDIQDRKNSPVILVCQSGNRSLQAARSLKKHGFETLYNLSGGMHAWQQGNLPIVSGNKSSGKDGSKEKPSKSGKKKQASHDISTSTNISSSSEQSAESAPELIESQEEKIIVYTSGYCPFTSKVKKLLKEKGVEYQQVSLDENADMRNLIADRSGQKTFPQVFKGDAHIGNCDELYQLDKEGKLNSILGLKPAQGVL